MPMLLSCKEKLSVLHDKQTLVPTHRRHNQQEQMEYLPRKVLID